MRAIIAGGVTLSMSTKTHGVPGQPGTFREDAIAPVHSPEPWKQDDRYIRDANGVIVVRGRTLADARRIVAAINATRDIPTDALEHWLVQDVSEPTTRPDLDILIGEEPSASPFAVLPPDGAPFPTGPAAPVPGPGTWPYALTSPERRHGERRRAERRAGTAAPTELLFDRRVLERRLGQRRSG